MRQGRDAYRNSTHMVFGLGIDAVVVVVVAALRSDLVLAAALVPVLALGLRWAMIRVVIDRRGVRVVNLWRTHRLVRVDGREIPISAASASGTMMPSNRVAEKWLPGLVARLNRGMPVTAAAGGLS
jgi:hypothetical protein